jgi:hypothetical protein
VKPWLIALAVFCLCCSVAGAEAPPTAGGMSDITVLSVDIGHFDYGNKIVHVFENSRNQTEFRDKTEKWQFVIEPLLSFRKADDGNVQYETFPLDPVYEKIGRYTYKLAKNRVLVPLTVINDWAREQALNVALAAYPDTKCKIGRSNVDVLPITEIEVNSPDIDDGLMKRNAVIHARVQNFLTSPRQLYLSFDITEKSEKSEDELKRFIAFIPFMTLNAKLSFSVKSTRFNITSITASKLRSTDLFTKLNGSGGVGYVTREDLRRLVINAANQLQASAIVEDPSFND